MSPSRQRFVTLLLATTGAAASFAHATTVENATPVQSQTMSTVDMLDRASTLINEGQLIRARALINALQDSTNGVVLSDEQDQRVWKLLAQIERTIKKTNRHEITLQKAQLALGFDRLVEAERQATNVLNADSSNADQIDHAQAILAQIESRRTTALPMISSTINAAVNSFNAGDYTTAKTIISRIGTLGLDLDAQSRRTLHTYRTRIADLEQSRGESFGHDTPSMGMLAPESGASTEWLISNAEEMLGQPTETNSDEPEVEIVEVTSGNDDVDIVETARKFEAQSVLANANIAFEERRLNDALNGYSNLMQNFASYLSAEDRALAAQRLNEVENSLGVQGGPTEGGIDDSIEERSIIMQRLTATYDNLTNQAQDALSSGDTSVAAGFVAQARLEVQRARDVMPEATYERYLAELDGLSSTIAQRDEQLRQARLEQEAIDREQRTLELEQQRLSERDQRIIASLERVRALQAELKYEEALEVVNNILFQDPANPSGLVLKDIIEDTT